MGLGKTEEQGTLRKTYLSISNGKIVYSNGKGQPISYSYCEGFLEGIYQRERNFGGENVVRWYIDLRDGEQIYSICFSYGSGTFKSIVLALASDKSLNSSTPVRIEPYVNNGYTKIKVFADGTKLDWVTNQLPDVKEIEIGGRKVKDDSKRMEFIYNLCNSINERISNK